MKPAAVACVVLMLLAASGRAAEPAVAFNRDVRPILAKHCFACHGQDEDSREAGLRLDLRETAVAELDSGVRAVVPEHPEQSALVERVTSSDEDLRMPPADAKRLTNEEIATLRRWIAAGAPYARHWSFDPPVRPSLPAVPDRGWPKSGIDYFTFARMHAAGLAPNEEADRYTLIRRLSLDLRGLPPTLEEVEQFVGDTSPRAYERLVDRLLADTAYGERWARVWLDLARYADSKGYGSDPLRKNIWRYRDWVIDAFNRNLPFDRFTIEQLAGDLLPEATLEQRVATAMHRNTMTNTEGGTDDEEFRVAAIKDRVDTTMQVWMGLTMGCGKCHSHKYDPITQREYYRFYAFFNQTADADRNDDSPVITAPGETYRRQVAAIERRIAEVEKKLAAAGAELDASQRKWEAELRDAGTDEKPAPQGRYVRVEVPGRGKLLSLAEVEVYSGGKNVALKAPARQSSTAYEGPAALAVDGNTDGDYFKARSTTHTKNEDNPWWEVDLGGPQAVDRITIFNRTDGNLQKRLVNFRVSLLDGKRQTLWQKMVAPFPDPSAEFTPAGGLRAAVPPDVLAIVDTPAEARSAAQQEKLNAYYRGVAPSLKPLRDELAKLRKSKPKPPTVPVLQELPPDQQRVTRVQIKGNFLNLGDEVQPGVPAAFHPFPEDAPHNRLGAARWLVDRRNPLTARVAVNRFWAQLFGVGLVETEEDFGTQGERPSHPQLLDWLAVEFMDGGWDVKRLLKTIVTSATYRQSARVAPEALEIDPRNRLLSHAPRFRLEAEMVRDQALALAGLLSRKTHGPSVYPPQPQGLWRAAFNGADRKWPTDQGEDRWRRGLYTFWRRTVPYPSMATFDAPSREICSVRRIRTNTPLQAFVMLNDPVYVEAAQALARRIVREGGDDVQSRARFALRLCLARPPSDEQVQVLLELHNGQLHHYQQDTEAAVQLATEPLGPLPEGMPPADLAAWTVVANVLLNMDGVLTKG